MTARKPDILDIQNNVIRVQDSLRKAILAARTSSHTANNELLTLVFK